MPAQTSLLSTLLEMPFEKLFENNGNIPGRKVYLLFDPKHKSDLILWSKAFEEAGAKVYTPEIEGKWDHFSKETKGGVVIVSVLTVSLL